MSVVHAAHLTTPAPPLPRATPPDGYLVTVSSSRMESSKASSWAALRRSIWAWSRGVIEGLAFAPGVVIDGTGQFGPFVEHGLAHDEEFRRQNEAAQHAGEGR